jgi:hypothetical protein
MKSETVSVTNTLTFMFGAMAAFVFTVMSFWLLNVGIDVPWWYYAIVVVGSGISIFYGAFGSILLDRLGTEPPAEK